MDVSNGDSVEEGFSIVEAARRDDLAEVPDRETENRRCKPAEFNASTPVLPATRTNRTPKKGMEDSSKLLRR